MTGKVDTPLTSTNVNLIKQASIEDVNGDMINDLSFKVYTEDLKQFVGLGETELFIHGMYGNETDGFVPFVIGETFANIF